MAEIASAFVSILPSAKGFGSKLNSEVSSDVDSAGKRAGARFGTAMKAGVLGAGVAITAAVGGFLKGAIDEGREAQKVGALTNAVIKSTGGIANVTAKDVDRLATSISLKTGVDDEAIAAGQNMLLTFGNVRNEVGKGNDIFNQATVAATDMAAAFGGDAVSNSKILGKALNDPTKGVSALTRVGVSFTEQQKTQIKTLQESGNVLGAQKIVLGELSKQTAGAAESQATSGDKFKTAFANLQESVGTILLPMFDRLLDAGAKFAVFLTNNVGPGIAAVNGFIAPIVTNLGYLKDAFLGAFDSGLSSSGAGPFAFATRLGAAFGELVPKVKAALGQLVAVVQTNFVPVLQTMSATFTGVVLPAILAVAGYVSSSLVPIFRQVWAIVSGQVIPIVASLAQFFYGTLYPAVLRIVTAIAGNLKPVFDQLVATFRGSVLPTISKLLAKFEEYRPTIQKVTLQVVKVVGAVLTFAAAIAGKVLPVAIRFAGFLIANVVPAIATVIGVLIKIISKVLDFGGALVDGVKKVARFATGVGEKIGAAFQYVKDLPDKVMGVLNGLATKMYGAGVKLVAQLAAGIRDKIGDAVDAMKAGVDRLKGLLPGSPIKWGPLKNWNNGGAGKRLMDLVALGITKATPKTVKAAKSAFEKIGDSLEAQRDKLRSTLDSLKSDFASIAESVSSAFTGNLFEATTAGGFIESLTAKKAELTGLLASFKTLRGWGVPGAFLSQLFASGNGALITELAGMGQAGAVGAASLFNDVQSLGKELGGAVASNDPVAKAIEDNGKELREVNRQLSFLADDIGKQLNGAASKAQRDKKNRGKK